MQIILQDMLRQAGQKAGLAEVFQVRPEVDFSSMIPAEAQTPVQETPASIELAEELGNEARKAESMAVNEDIPRTPTLVDRKAGQLNDTADVIERGEKTERLRPVPGRSSETMRAVVISSLSGVGSSLNSEDPAIGAADLGRMDQAPSLEALEGSDVSPRKGEISLLPVEERKERAGTLISWAPQDQRPATSETAPSISPEPGRSIPVDNESAREEPRDLGAELAEPKLRKDVLDADVPLLDKGFSIDVPTVALSATPDEPVQSAKGTGTRDGTIPGMALNPRGADAPMWNATAQRADAPSPSTQQKGGAQQSTQKPASTLPEAQVFLRGEVGESRIEIRRDEKQGPSAAGPETLVSYDNPSPKVNSAGAFDKPNSLSVTGSVTVAPPPARFQSEEQLSFFRTDGIEMMRLEDRSFTESLRRPEGAPRLDAHARPMVQQITTAASKVLPDGSLEIQLSPEELGRVRLTVSSGDLGVSVQLMVERSETLDLVRRHLDLLEQDLRDQGFTDLSFSTGQEHPMPNEQNSSHGEDDHTQGQVMTVGGADSSGVNIPSDIALGQLDIRL